MHPTYSVAVWIYHGPFTIVIIPMVKSYSIQFNRHLKWLILKLVCGKLGKKLFLRRTEYGSSDLAAFLGLDTNDYDYNQAKASKSLELLRQEIDGNLLSHSLPPRAQKNITVLGEMMGLRPNDLRVLGFLLLLQGRTEVSLATGLFKPESAEDEAKLTAQALDMPLAAVKKCVAMDGKLMTCGLFTNSDGAWEGYHFVSSRLVHILLYGRFTRHTKIPDFGTLAPPSDFSPADFERLAEPLDLLASYLRQVLCQKKNGANVLLHGPAGVGKTQFARMLAGLVGAQLIEVPSRDSDGKFLSQDCRLKRIAAVQNYHRESRCIILFDNAEKVFKIKRFSYPKKPRVLKGWRDSLLGTNGRPMIWITNATYKMAPANLRKFDFVLPSGLPTMLERRKMLGKILGDSATPALLEQLVQANDLAPAVVARVYEVISTIGPVLAKERAESALRLLVGNRLKVEGKRAMMAPTTIVGESMNDPDFLNTPIDLQAVIEGLKRRHSGRICLYGPPGTGKTTFGHWLSRELNLPLTSKLASDLISMYIGETEQKIAAAFEDARVNGAILMIDEVDSFLRDRSLATRSWEVSQVNELLVQMERFDGIFIASTNLMDNLDAASLRRFDLKLEFGYLRDEQAERLLARHCAAIGFGLPDGDAIRNIRALGNATPGDFANAARQHAFRGFSSPTEFAAAVVAECAHKKNGVQRPLGFHCQP